MIRGFEDVVSKIAEVATDEKDRPAVPVTIYNCGELELRKKPAPPRSSYFLSFFGGLVVAHFAFVCLITSEGVLREC